MKIICELKIPSLMKSALITREMEVDEERYKKIKNKKLFLDQLFLREISNELEINCIKVF